MHNIQLLNNNIHNQKLAFRGNNYSDSDASEKRADEVLKRTQELASKMKLGQNKPADTFTKTVKEHDKKVSELKGAGLWIEW